MTDWEIAQRGVAEAGGRFELIHTVECEDELEPCDCDCVIVAGVDFEDLDEDTLRALARVGMLPSWYSVLNG